MVSRTHAIFTLSLPLWSLLATSAQAQTIPSVGDESPRFGHVTRLIEDHMQDTGTGAANLQIRNKAGDVIYNRAFGWLDEGKTQANQLDSMMRVASISKLFTRHAIRHLVDHHVLSFDAKAFCLAGESPSGSGCLLPVTPQGLDGVADPRAKDITLRHLFDHRAGWRHDTVDVNGVKEPLSSSIEIAEILGVPSPPSYAELLEYALDQDLSTDPGSEESYSNFGYAILGHIIEVYGGHDFMAYIHQNITAPIGIANSEMELGIEVVEGRNPREPNYISWNPDVRGPNFFDPDGPHVREPDGRIRIATAAGAGGIISTTDALLKYAREFWFDTSDPRNLNQDGYWVAAGAGDGTLAMLSQDAPLEGLDTRADWALMLNRRIAWYDILHEVGRSIRNTLQKDRTVRHIEGNWNFDQRMGLYIPYDAINLRISFRQYGNLSCRWGEVWSHWRHYVAGDEIRHLGRRYRANHASDGRVPDQHHTGPDPLWIDLGQCDAHFSVMAMGDDVPDAQNFDCISTGGGDHDCTIANAPAGMYHIVLRAMDNEFHGVEATPYFDWVHPCEPLNDWSGTLSYETGDEVRHLGQRYRANYWSQNSAPDQHSGPWESWTLLDECTGSCSSPNYAEGQNYVAGDLVQNLGREYRCEVPGWCGQGGAYTPGSGWAWEQAWTQSHVCR